MSKKRKASAFRGKVSQDVQRQKKQASSYGYLRLPKDVSIFKEDPDSRIKLDFIPYVISDKNHPDRDDENGIAIPGEIWYKRPFRIHRNIGANNDAVICLSSFGKKCPICEYRKEAVRNGEEKEVIDAMKSSPRNLYIVIPKGSKKYDEEIHIWDISQYLFQNLLNEELEEDPENEVFPDLEEGKTLKIRFTEGSIGKNKFAEASRIDFYDRDEAYEESILDEVPDLDAMLIEMSYEKLERLFLEEDVPEDENTEEEEEEDNSPKRKRKSTRTKQTNDEEEEEEEEPPKRRKKGMMTRDREREEEKQTKQSSRKRRTKNEKECPHGYTFGVDTDQYDECEDCKVWEECDEKNAELNE